jgi:tight adherence protein C
MNPMVLMAAFFVTVFVMVMGAITIAGYFVLSRTPAGASAVASGQPSIVESALQRVGEAIPSRREQAKQYRKKLILAGYRQENAAELYFGLRIASTAVLAILCGAVKLLMGGDLAFAIVAMCAGGGIGYLIPNRILQYLISRRANRILYGIPAAIDLMVLSLEAGQSLDAALAETARELRNAYPELSGELHQVQLEMPASRSRAEVFRSLADRNTEPELKRLAQVFLDSDRFGTGLAPALRTHVKFLRVRLRQQAYEQARKISVKLVFPVFFLIFPSVILVTLGPALIQVYSQLNVLLK